MVENNKVLELVCAYDHINEVNQLFTEYTNMLIKGDSSFKKYLELQNYNEEINQLELKYGLPYGRLYLAYYGGKLAGCIGLHKIDETICELKRLYVRPDFRGKSIGNQLVQRIIDDARGIGYKQILLDTLPFLKSAVRMYKKFGFSETTPYNNSPMKTSIFMKLDLV